MSWSIVKRGCLIALSLFSIVDNMEIDVKAATTKHTDTAEPILADVMKNITRVNTMLQELIKNYEKLEKISKAHSDESEFTDAEVEALFDFERKKRNRTKTKTTMASPTHKIYATAMFVDEPGPVRDSKSESENTESSSNSGEVKKEEKTKKKEAPPKKNNDKIKNEDKKAKQTVEKPTEFNIEKEIKITKSEVKNEAEKSLAPAIEAFKDLIKNLSDEPASTDSGEANDKNDTKIITTSRSSTAKSLKPVLSELRSEETLAREKKHLEPRLEPYEMPEIFRRVRKSNDEDTILIGTPVKENLTEGKYGKSHKKKILEPLDNKVNSSWSVSETDSSEETKIIQKEELKTNVLRQAYGDACMNLVVRKCTKACRSVLKDVCNRRRHCPRSIRDTFKTHALRGCRDAFRSHNHSAKQDWRMYSGRVEDNGSDEFQDVTRNGYLACFPNRRMPVEKQDNSTTNVTIEPAVKSMNILRDRYENACKEESMRKCYKACTAAGKKACEESKCSRRRLREFGGACKRRCKQNYGVRERRSRESDSDSDSDSSDSDDSDGNKSKGHHHEGDESWE